MTILILRILFVLFFFSAVQGPVGAAPEDSSVEVLADGKKYCSFEDYARSRALPAPVPLSVQQTGFEAKPAGQEVAGITPSLAEIVREFHGLDLSGKPLCTAQGLAQALERSVQGKEGPLLVIADARKLKILELK